VGQRPFERTSNFRNPPRKATRAVAPWPLEINVLTNNLGNLMRTLAMPQGGVAASPTSLPERLTKIGAKVVSHGGYVTFQMAKVAVPRQMFEKILSLIARLRALMAPA
jgi:hypothetical protein